MWAVLVRNYTVSRIEVPAGGFGESVRAFRKASHGSLEDAGLHFADHWRPSLELQKKHNRRDT